MRYTLEDYLATLTDEEREDIIECGQHPAFPDVVPCPLCGHWRAIAYDPDHGDGVCHEPGDPGGLGD